MASSSTFTNLLSFLLPAKPPPLKTSPPQLSFSCPPASQLQTRESKNGSVLVCVVAKEEGHSCSAPSLSAELSSVIYPSLAYANTLYYDSKFNVQVDVEDDGEPEEVVLSRFRREVMRAGVIQECKRRRFYENKKEEKKRKTREAARRNRRRRLQSRPPSAMAEEVPDDKDSDDDDDIDDEDEDDSDDEDEDEDWGL